MNGVNERSRLKTEFEKKSFLPNTDKDVCPHCKEILPYFDELLNRLPLNLSGQFIDENEFRKRFHISAKTSLRFRNAGLKFSQPTGKKIFYKIKWIEDFLESYSKEGF